MKEPRLKVRRDKKEKRLLPFASLAATCYALSPSMAYADIWSTAQSALGEFEGQLFEISTKLGTVAALIALLGMLISRSDKNTMAFKSWLVRILIAYAGINAIGLAFSYIQSLNLGAGA